MCGIAGVLDPSARDAGLRAVGESIAKALRHRGPDDSGIWCESGVVLAHRRLAVIDLTSAGHQPMVSPTGRYVLSYNGEIYNFRDLRRRLETVGDGFRGGSDTEVLLASIARWGVERALVEANGMFALALWDREERTLTLARDRFGEKPLYFAVDSTSAVFGSELKALRATGRQWGVDRAAIGELLGYGYVSAPRSILSGVEKVRPGEIVEISAETMSVRRRRYWTPPVAPWTGGDDQGDRLDELEQLVTEAVGLRMVADVPIGAFLSGGIDSSLIVATMQRLSPRPVNTFTIGFTEKTFDEAVYARSVAKVLGTEHHELYVTPREAQSVIPRLPDIFDEPFADVSQIPTYLVARLAREHVTVALSGDGGDELFGGYERYVRAMQVVRKMGVLPGPIRRAVGSIGENLGPGILGAVAGVALRARRSNGPVTTDVGHKAMRLASMLKFDGERSVYDSLLRHWHDPASVVLGLKDQPRYAADVEMPHDYLDWMMRADLAVYLPDDILVKVDRASMAVSLESRIPLLDPSIVAFALRLPSSERLVDGRGKGILRDLLARSVPRELFERPKMGFGVPMGDWLRGPLRQWAEDLLAPSQLSSQGYLDPVPVGRMWAEHQTGIRNWQYALWDVLMFQGWLARWEQG